MLLYEFCFGAGIATAFGLLILCKTKKVYERGEPFPLSLSVGWWVLDTAWTGLVASSSFYNLWRLPADEALAWIAGLALLLVGTFLTLAGMMEFRSLRKVSGMEASNLVTTGVYRWSRNPQFLGFYLALLGISLLGRSGFALLLTVIAVIYCHYYIVKMEEPYLERIFGKEYVTYKSRTPRYIGVPRSKE